MTDRVWKVYKVLLVIGLCTAIINYRIACGFLLGALTSVFLLKRIERFVDAAIDMQHASNKQAFISFMLNYAVMAAVLVIAALMPNIFNIFATALGLMAIKLSVIIESLLFKEGMVEQRNESSI